MTTDPRVAELRQQIAELDEDAADIRSLLAYAEGERWDKLDDELGEILDRRKALIAEYRALRSKQDQAAPDATQPRRRGRPPLGERAMTAAERMRRVRERRRAQSRRVQLDMPTPELAQAVRAYAEQLRREAGEQR